MKNIRKGFTIIEVLAVMIIIAMASLVSIPKIDDVMNQPKNLKVMTDLKSYEFAILELHYAKEPITASSISSIVDSELEFTLGESKGDNPYGNKYKLIQNGPDDVTIESLKSGSRIIDVVQSLHAYKTGNKMIIEYKNIDESLSSEIIIDRTATTPPPSNVNSYYTFELDASSGGMKVGLQSSFRNAIESGQPYLEWKPGLPLPNPGVNFGPNEITSYKGMFKDIKVSEIDVSNFQTEGIVSTEMMFKDCTSKIIGIENWRLNNLTSTRYMFYGYVNAESRISLNGKFTGTEGTNSVNEMFVSSELKEIDLSKFNMDNVDDLNSMFDMVTVDKLKLGNINNVKVTNLDRFLKSVRVNNFEAGTVKFPNVNNFSSSFDIESDEIVLTNMELNTSLSWSVSNPFSTDYTTYYMKDIETINKFRSIPTLCENSTLTLKPVNVENYYKYTLVGGGYAVSLTSGFKGAINTGKDYKNWEKGSPMPNPGKMYNGKPVISYKETFMGITAETVDLTLWDTSKIIDTSGMFMDSNIGNLNISYWRNTGTPLLSANSMFKNSKIGNIPSINKLTIDRDTNMDKVFDGSTMNILVVDEEVFEYWVDYKTNVTEVVSANNYPAKVPNNVLDYYTFTSVAGGYRVGLNESFKTALINKVNYKDWKAGTPLPNPGSTYNSLPVVSTASVFAVANIARIDLRYWDTSNVTDMSTMFVNSSATSVVLTGLNTSKVTNMSMMFSGSGITSLDISNFDTSKVTNMSLMFSSCKATEYKLGKFDMSNVTNASSLFSGTKQTTTMDFTFLTKSIATDMSNMFASSSFTTINLSNMRFANVTNATGMFSKSAATTINITNLEMPNLINVTDMFKESKATTIDLSAFYAPKVTIMKDMFNGTLATSINLANLNTANVTNMSGMFRFVKLVTLNLSSFNTSKVTDMSYMFTGSQMTTLDVSMFNTSNVTNMSYMFLSSKVTTLNLLNFNTTKVTNMIGMFENSSVLTLDLSAFNMTSVTSTGGMFSNAKATTGYARNTTDRDKLNATTSKPAGLVFTVK